MGIEMTKKHSDIHADLLNNRFAQVLIAARRARELQRGWKPLIKSKNGPLVTALNEIEQGHIGMEYLKKPQTLGRKELPPEDQR